MTEHNPENDHQDPAEQYKVDEAVQTEEQAPEAEPTPEESSDSDDADPEPPTPSTPVQVSPEVPSDTKTHTSSGVTYEVTPERGFRQVNEA